MSSRIVNYLVWVVRCESYIVAFYNKLLIRTTITTTTTLILKSIFQLIHSELGEHL